MRSFRLTLSLLFVCLCVTAGWMLSDTQDAHAAASAKWIETVSTLDLASLVDGAGVGIAQTVPGAALGDACMVSLGVSNQGLLTTCSITAAATIGVRFQNETGGTIDLASTTMRTFLQRRNPVVN